MTTLQEIFTVTYDVELEKMLPGFEEKFGDKINVFRINTEYNFEIDFLDSEADNEELKKEIIQFIKKELSELKVIFVDSQLPF